jgi:hypothetical protein
VLVGAGADELDPSLNGVYHRPGRGSTDEEMLRFGIAFSDGRKATTVGGLGHGPGEPADPSALPRYAVPLTTPASKPRSTTSAWSPPGNPAAGCRSSRLEIYERKSGQARTPRPGGSVFVTAAVSSGGS